MLSFKFNFFVLLLLISISAWAIDEASCLHQNFDTKVQHKSAPFGLLKTVLHVTKNDCQISIEHQRYKFVHRKWLIDVCRGPIHFKVGESQDVLKKKVSCTALDATKNDDFCVSYSELNLLVQDDGLIFADGEKEDMNSAHGKIYCAYLLYNAYALRDIIFNRQDNVINTLEEKKYQVSPPLASTPVATQK